MNNIYSITSLALLVILACGKAFGGTPIGNLDSVGPATAGWSCTESEPTRTTYIQIYLEKDGNYTHALTMPANAPSELALAVACKVPKAAALTQGFRFAVDIRTVIASVKAQGAKRGVYRMYVYGVNATTSTLLTNSNGQAVFVP